MTACIGVTCAPNATCFATGTYTTKCLCNDGFQGDGVNRCSEPKFGKWMVMKTERRGTAIEQSSALRNVLE